MASLKEIKGRISSVKSTLKITSAMKMVASARLHKAQSAIEGMLPYEKSLHRILEEVMPSGSREEFVPYSAKPEDRRSGRVAVVAVASNSSLCGAFNNNVIKEARKCISDLEAEGLCVDVYPVGKKMADAMRRDGRTCQIDLSHLVADAKYDDAASLAQMLTDAYVGGKYDRVMLVYNHFVSTATQKPQTDVYLPMMSPSGSEPSTYILEPSADDLLRELLPKLLKLKIFTVLLDSVASEHSARTVAMQTATDNGERILSDLTLEYNKGRQQKITSEILDLVGGAQQ